ncbi:MAG: hypothetical protein AAB880_02655 [Patescibacteria group bacterium]
MLLAVLGRGVQEISDGNWDVTEDLEVCDPAGAHFLKRVPLVDDHNPHCLVGGGQLSILAGVELHRKLGAELMVCGYAHRLPYLLECGGPTDSEVGSACFRAILDSAGLLLPEILVWPRDKVMPEKSNTARELQNMLELAVERGIEDVAVVTVAVHLPRTILFAQEIVRRQDHFQPLELSFYASEQVLAEANAGLYATRVLSLQMSQAYARTAFYERRGVQAWLAGIYR